LIEEKAELEALLETPEPTDEELIELGRMKYMEDNIYLNEVRLSEVTNIINSFK